MRAGTGSGYHGDTFGAMAVCDPINGMHSLFRGSLAKHVFAPAPSCGFAETDDALLARRREKV